MKDFKRNLALPAVITITALTVGGGLFANAQTSEPTCTLSAVPSSIASGDYSTLTWVSTGADDLEFDQGIGSTTPVAAGSISIHPTSTPITYTGTFTGPDGAITCETTIATAAAPYLTPVPSGPITSDASAPIPVPVVMPAPVATVPTAVNTAEPMPTVVQIDGSGNILMRGIVTASTPDSLTIASWGGSWTVSPLSGISIVPVGTNGVEDFSRIAVGDFIGAEGTVSLSQPFAINASVVHDWTLSVTSTVTPTSAISTTTGATTDAMTGTASSTMIPSGDTLYIGTVSDIGASSFMLTDANGTTYTVNLAPGALLWDSASGTLELSDFTAGDSLRLDGALQSDGSISADVVRDTSK